MKIKLHKYTTVRFRGLCKYFSNFFFFFWAPSVFPLWSFHSFEGKKWQKITTCDIEHQGRFLFCAVSSFTFKINTSISKIPPESGLPLTWSCFDVWASWGSAEMFTSDLRSILQNTSCQLHLFCIHLRNPKLRGNLGTRLWLLSWLCLWLTWWLALRMSPPTPGHWARADIEPAVYTYLKEDSCLHWQLAVR